MMDDRIKSAIDVLVEQLVVQEREVVETKRLINRLYERAGEVAPYSSLDDQQSMNLDSLRRDQFYGRPLATVIREYLEMRRAAGQGPATVNEIYDALVRGGFTFSAKNAENAKRGVYISLGKNSTTFHRLPGGADDQAVFGLLDWYPNAKTQKANNGANGQPTNDDEVSAMPNRSSGKSGGAA